MKIAVIGGGAAGFFAALSAKEYYPESELIILEKSQQLLSKVKISGGGRCNVTNGCATIDQLTAAYPRGGRQLKKLFGVFNNHSTIEWFESRGVPLTIQEDKCVFPSSQDSQTIVDCFLGETERLGIKIITGTGIEDIKTASEGINIYYKDIKREPQLFNKVIIATGGSPKREGLHWLERCGHKIVDPLPSLFSFNMPSEPVKNLMGVVVEKASATIQGTKIKADGALLITHWGMSGPAILKLSSFGARILRERDYNFKIGINWINEPNNEIVTFEIDSIIAEHSGKMLSSVRPYSLPVRLWMHLLEKCEISSDKRWSELGKKGINKIVNTLTNDEYTVKGKATFREEFVTCGGVSLDSINLNTLESKVVPNLYFAGEVLDIDAITGGFNLQAAWTTGFIAGKLG
ncbi:MAG: NAD(P)/FAD-dependent oxidoreductase [Bacteroidales bacterium]